ncbi:MAG: response regulator [Elusimicrobiota bacterium]
MKTEKRIIYIGEKKYNSDFLQRFLGEEDYSVEVIESFTDISSNGPVNGFAVVIIDIEYMNSKYSDFFKDFQNTGLKPVLIGITGEKRAEKEAEYFKKGIVDFIYKPYNIGFVRDLLSKIFSDYEKNGAVTARKRILIVDDELMIRKTLTKILVEANYDVNCTSSGELALERLKNRKYDLVLLDIKLKGIDGLQTLEKIKKINPDIPVIIISGYLTIENIEMASRFGIFSYIRKPFQLTDLREKIKRAFLNH